MAAVCYFGTYIAVVKDVQSSSEGQMNGSPAARIVPTSPDIPAPTVNNRTETFP